MGADERLEDMRKILLRPYPDIVKKAIGRMVKNMGGSETMGEIKLKPCPKCKQEVEVRGGDIDWVPTFYDPDSGGDPYEIRCKCGIRFCIGYCEECELVEAWNKRAGEEGEVE